MLVYFMTLFIKGFEDVKKWRISQYPQEIGSKDSSS